MPNLIASPQARGTRDPSTGVSAVSQVSAIYGIDNWASGTSPSTESGHLTIAPHRIPGRTIDVYEVVRQQVAAQQSLPFLLRFPQVLDERLASLHEAFATAIAEFRYGGRHVGAYPVR